jgi:hypothetical protein
MLAAISPEAPGLQDWAKQSSSCKSYWLSTLFALRSREIESTASHAAQDAVLARAQLRISQHSCSKYDNVRTLFWRWFLRCDGRRKVNSPLRLCPQGERRHEDTCDESRNTLAMKTMSLAMILIRWMGDYCLIRWMGSCSSLACRSDVSHCGVDRQCRNSKLAERYMSKCSIVN